MLLASYGVTPFFLPIQSERRTTMATTPSDVSGSVVVALGSNEENSSIKNNSTWQGRQRSFNNIIVNE